MFLKTYNMHTGTGEPAKVRIIRGCLSKSLDETPPTPPNLTEIPISVVFLLYSVTSRESFEALKP